MGNLSSLRVSPGQPGFIGAVGGLTSFHTFFSLFARQGDRFWVFSDSSMEKDSPKSLADLGTGLPTDKMDAALFYTPTGQTYFFRGTK